MKQKRQKKIKPTKKKLLLKIEDVVQVISGKDRGKVGKIVNIDRYKERVTVEGVNIVTKHIKPQQAGQEGKIERFETPVHYSNVLLYCEKSGRGERLRISINDDGSKTRVFAQSGTPAD